MLRRTLATATAAPAKALRVGLLLKRNPLVLPPLEPFDRAYALHKDEQTRNASRPLHHGFYFKRGSLAEQRYLAYADARHSKGENVVFQADELAQAAAEGVTTYGKDGDRTSLERMADRALYLVVREKSSSEWALPERPLSGEEQSLAEAARTTIAEKCGCDVDTWVVGNIPVGVRKDGEATTFYMKAHIFAGDLATGKETEHAWATRSELPTLLRGDYYAQVAGMVTER